MNLRKRVIESTIIAVMLTVVTAVTAVMQTASVCLLYTSPGRSAECQKRKLFRTGRCRGFRNDKDYGTGIHSGGQGRMHH